MSKVDKFRGHSNDHDDRRDEGQFIGHAPKLARTLVGAVLEPLASSGQKAVPAG